MKKGYRQAEICRLLGLQPYVLRYWATEFPRLEGGGEVSDVNRVYSEADVALLRRIKSLLYEEGFTIAGAKKRLEIDPPVAGEPTPIPLPLFGETEASASAAAVVERSVALDSSNGERIESLQRGIATALDEARSALAILDRSS